MPGNLLAPLGGSTALSAVLPEAEAVGYVLCASQTNVAPAVLPCSVFGTVASTEQVILKTRVVLPVGAQPVGPAAKVLAVLLRRTFVMSGAPVT